MILTSIRLVVLCLTPALLSFAPETGRLSTEREYVMAQLQDSDQKPVEENAIKVHYLEIVTAKVDGTCLALGNAHGVTFGEPIAEFGNARTTNLRDGGIIGVRAPMRETEQPVVRPYLLVDDIEAAIKAAESAGGKVAMPPMEIPGHGTFATWILGGIEHGLWQL